MHSMDVSGFLQCDWSDHRGGLEWPHGAGSQMMIHVEFVDWHLMDVVLIVNSLEMIVL
ncbi:hypothetical protein J6590_025332 [Homalodisca vitripennis]|nr:hypothetical protein J6590_025332 [Homalodisca vitripennis]